MALFKCSRYVKSLLQLFTFFTFQRRKNASPPIENDDGIPSEIKKKMRDNIGISFVSPTTGKKRVQCNVCLKTFCDKGALKIHFSAVHLR